MKTYKLFFLLLAALPLVMVPFGCKKNSSTPPPKKKETKDGDQSRDSGTSTDKKDSEKEEKPLILWAQKLVEKTNHSQLDIRRSAYYALLRLKLHKPFILKAFLEGYNSDDEQIREYSWSAIQLGNDKYTPHLVSLLSDRKQKGRVLEILDKIKASLSGKSVSDLVEVLEGDNEKAKKAAVSLLKRVRLKKKEELGVDMDRLVSLLKSKEGDLRVVASVLLGKMGDKATPAVPTLIKLLQDPVMEVVQVTVMSLAKIGKKSKSVVAAIAPLLDHSNPQVQGNAAYALGEFGSLAAPYALKVISLVGKLPLQGSLSALISVGNMGSEGGKAVPALLKHLSHKNSVIQAFSAQALGQIGIRGETVIPAVLQAVKKGNPTVQTYGVKALQNLVVKSPGYVAKVLKGTDQSFRKNILDILLQVKPMPSLVEPLGHVLEKGTSREKFTAAKLLWALGDKAEPVRPVLEKTLAEADKDSVRMAAAKCLGKLGKKSVAPLKKALSDKSPQVRGEVLLNLASLEGAKAMAHLKKGLVDGDKLVRNLAVKAIASLNKDGVEPVLEMLKDKDPRYQSRAIFLVVQLKEHLSDPSSHLAPFLTNKDSSLVIGALISLRRLAPTSSDELGDQVFSLMFNRNRRVAEHAARTLIQWGDRGVAVLLRHLKPGGDKKKIRYIIYVLAGFKKLPSSVADTLWPRLPLSGVPAKVVEKVLVAVGKRGLDPLYDALTSRSKNRRNLASSVIKKLGQEALPLLRKGLKSSEMGVQLMSAHLLLPLKGDGVQAIPELEKMARHKNRSLARAAVVVLANMEKKAAPASETLVRGLYFNLGPANKNPVVKALIKIGHPAIPPLWRHFDEAKVHQLITYTLSKLKSKSIILLPFLMEKLDQVSWTRRGNVCYIMAGMGTSAGFGAARLVPLVESDRKQLRNNAAYALEKMGGRAMPALEKLLQSDQLRTRLVALTLMSKLKRGMDSAVPHLIKVLQGNEESAQLRAALVLAKVGEKGREAVPILKKLLTHSNWQMRTGAFKALLAIEGKSEGLFLQGLRDSRWEGVAYTLNTLGEEKLSRWPKVLAKVSTLVEHSRPQVRSRAVKSLGFSQSPQAVEPLVKALSDKNKTIRQVAMEALSNLVPNLEGGEKYLGVFERNLTRDELLLWVLKGIGRMGKKAAPLVPKLIEVGSGHGNFERRLQVISTLKKVGEVNLDQAKALGKWLSTESDGKVQRELLLFLAQLGAKSVPALDAVRDKLWKSSYESIQLAAVRALAGMSRSHRALDELNRARKSSKLPKKVKRLAEQVWKKHTNK